MSLRVLTVNIHKGFALLNRRFVLPALRDANGEMGVGHETETIALPQHVAGLHSKPLEQFCDQEQYEKRRQQ